MTMQSEEYFLDKLYKLQNLILLLEDTNYDGFLGEILGENKFNNLACIVFVFKQRIIKMRDDHMNFYGNKI